MSELIIYSNAENQINVEVTFENETFWLSLNQISTLFERDKSVISRHLNNIYKEHELDKGATVAKNATVQNEAGREVIRQIEYYNLDAILSVGYRVNSKRGTQFRQWATQRLKEYLVQGYTINQKRLEQVQNNLNELENTIKFIRDKTESTELSLTEAKGLIDVIPNYTRSLVVLSRYDSQTLEAEQLNKNITYEISYDEANGTIKKLRDVLMEKKEASELFGNQKDESFKGILGNIVQTFGGEYLYASIEEQAAHLLYFVIKNHPFSDGNKRIGAFLFVWFLDKNKHLVTPNGKVKINDNALVALALLVAQSNPDDKELMIKLIVNLINKQ
ncbi:MAG TPA: virulence protein RhuM/Fic/DOC family protein [Bacteroidia bacterium]|nr:virulence protein RhuM/Fic/DOC family protein [Bacteroidia bacterium]